MFGQSTEDISRVKAAGIGDDMLSHFQRAIGEGGPGLAALKLSPEKLESEPLKDALSEVATKFNALPSAVERATVAEELFGREGREMIPVLAHLKEKMEAVPDYKIIHPKEAAGIAASDKEWAMAGGWTGPITKPLDRGIEAIGGTGGLSTQFSRLWTRLGDFSSGHTFDDVGEKHEREFEKDDMLIRTAESRAWAKRRRITRGRSRMLKTSGVSHDLGLDQGGNAERAAGNQRVGPTGIQCPPRISRKLGQGRYQ